MSQWGHDFRPAYLALRDAIKKLGRPPVLALTATATQEVTADIVKQLALSDPVIVSTGVERKNLFFEVLRTPSAANKPDIRFVIHYTFPDSIETYYQEAGRGGRDGAEARATLLYKLEDRRIQAYFLGGKYPTRAESWRVYEALSALSSRERPGRGVPLAKLAEAAGIGPKRARVVAAQLEGAGVLERRGGRLVQVRALEGEAQVDAFLTE